MKKYFFPIFILVIFFATGCDFISKYLPFGNKEKAPSMVVNTDSNLANPPPTAIAPSAPSHPNAENNPAIGGIYSVYGVNPRGRGSYRGIVTVTKQGDQYLFHWRVGNIYDGIGTLKRNTLSVEWGTAQARVGVVTYTLESNGTLQGTWFMDSDPSGIGRETLTPQRR